MHAFFDAYEQRRVDVLDRLYADDCVIWHNVFGRDTTRDENLERFHDSHRASGGAPTTTASSTRSRTGCVIQYTLAGVQTTGHRGALWICIVGRCRDGKITRIDEYMDSGRFAEWAGTRGGTA